MAEAGAEAGRAPTLRLFFALWPDAATRAALHARARMLHAECGGRVMRRDTIHMTLAFLGDTPARDLDRLQALAALAALAGGHRFTFAVDRVGSWKRNRILWSGPSLVPQALIELVRSLEARLRAAGFVLEERAFAPHVTLARNADAAPAEAQVEPLQWAADDFVLVASERSAAGARYRTIGRWPLAQ